MVYRLLLVLFLLFIPISSQNISICSNDTSIKYINIDRISDSLICKNNDSVVIKKDSSYSTIIKPNSEEDEVISLLIIFIFIILLII